MDSAVDVIVYGTPLEPLHEDETPDKKPVQDLTVRDENGRRRFHGAFTGGFSAGYYNTVGTKEGWTPSYFKSSRYLKADKLKQRPEDFMDPEDLNQFGIAPRMVQATKDFRTSAEEKPSNSSWNANIVSIPGTAPLEDLIKPVSDNIGIRLLRAMGWKPGQGIGPRVKRKAKPKLAEEVPASTVKVYGCAKPTELSDEEFDDYALAFTFAPEDISTLPYLSKDNVHGIGYSGMEQTDLFGNKFSSEDPNTTRAVMKTGKKIAIKGQAFGVGAFEDDDEDIYAKDDMRQYDFELTDHSQKDKKRKKPLAIKEKEAKREISGFHLAAKPGVSKKIYPPPEIPADYVPNRRMIAATIAESFPKPPPARREATPEVVNKPTTTKFLNRHVLSAAERAEMLGDKFQTKAPEHLSETIIPQLVKTAPPTMLPTPTASQLKEEWRSRLASLQKDPKLTWTASRSPSDLKPFVSDLAKQKRYEIYLEMMKADRSDFGSFQLSSMTEWEKEKEREEFYRAAVLFRPLTGTLSHKFVSKGTNLENDHEEIMAARKKSAKEADERLRSEIKVRRTTQEWHPDKLLCRRFNVPNPFSDSAIVGTVGATKQNVSIFEFLPTTENTVQTKLAPETPKAKKDVLQIPPAKSATNLAQSTPLPVATPKLKPVNTSIPQSDATVKISTPASNTFQENVPESAREAPSLDLFKAIFANSDSESASEVEDEEEEKEDIPIKSAPRPVKEVHNFPKEAPAGIFAFLGRSNHRRNGDSKDRETLANSNPSEKVASPGFYGPALPPDLFEVPGPKLNREHPPSSHKYEHKAKKSKKDKHKKKKSKRKHDTDDDLNDKLKKRLRELSKTK